MGLQVEKGQGAVMELGAVMGLGAVKGLKPGVGEQAERVVQASLGVLQDLQAASEEDRGTGDAEWAW